jgi:hypothetical protein
MADKTLITLTSPEGATLNTAGKYCDKDIEIVPNLQEKVATESGIVTADDGYVAMKSVDTTGVFEAGKKSEYDAFWDAFQNKGTRDHYGYSFAGLGWSYKNYYPKYSMIPKYATSMFEQSRVDDVYSRLDEKNLVLDFSECIQIANVFYAAYTEHLRRIDVRKAEDLGNLFSYSRIVTIEALVVDESASYRTCFVSSKELTNLTIEGTIGKNGFNVQWSTLLTHDSLMSIINALKDYSEDTSGTEWVVTLGAENIAKLTEEEILIAENKGWRIV